MKNFSMRAKVIILGLFILGILNIYTNYWGGENHGLIREMRLVSKQNLRKYQENLDEVVLKHIPLGSPANVAVEICKKNGFETSGPTNIRGSRSAVFPNFEEEIYCSIKTHRWYLITTDEYRVIVYLRNNQVGAVVGRFFAQTFV